MNALPNPVDQKIAEKVNEILDEARRGDIRAMAEPEGTIEAMPYGDEGRKIVRNRIPEVTLVKTVNKIPDSIEEMDDLSRWFPGLSPQLPLVNISISSSVHSNPMYDEKNGVEIPPESVIHEDSPFPLEYHIIETGVDVEERIEIPHGLSVYATENFSVGWFRTEFFMDIYDNFVDITTEDMLEFYDLKPYVETWEDRVFHFDQVLRAYRQNQTGLLIVLLSVFFESYIENELDEYLSELKKNPNAGSIIDSMDFNHMLNSCRYFDLVGDSEYNIIDKTKNSRNDYAHDMNSFRTTESTQLEKEGLVEEAIELYEELIEVEGSMIE